MNNQDKLKSETESKPQKGRWRNVITLAFAGIVDAGEDQAMSG